MWFGRILSLLIAMAYVTIGVNVDGLMLGARIAFGCLLPCACIWFPEALGDSTGGLLSNVTKSSPAPFVYVLGWVVLLTPIIGLGFMWIETIGMH
jgi:hypothetical protein